MDIHFETDAYQERQPYATWVRTKTIKSTWQARWRSVCLAQKLSQVCTHCGRDANTFRTLAIVVQQAIVSLCLNIQAASIQCSRFSRRIRESGDYPSYYPGKTADQLLATVKVWTLFSRNIQTQCLQY